MNKTTFKLLMVAVLATVMAMPQVMMAKKINYLGHFYNGKVNKQNVPEGKGEMNVGGLVITGVFDDRLVTDAMVKIMDEIKGPHNCRFYGTVNYDESDNITLNAGGLFYTRYYNKRFDFRNEINGLEGYMNEIIDTLKENRIVKAYGYGFEKNKIDVPFYYDLDARELGFNRYYGDMSTDDMLKLDLPTGEIKTYYTLGLKKATVRRFSNFYETYIFAPENNGVFEINSIDGYKDSKGRLWSLRINNSGRIESFSVKYPNGDVFSTGNNWEIHYPNGQIIRWNGSYIDLGNGMYLAAKIGDFFDLRGKDRFCPPQQYEYGIYDNSFEKTTPSSEVEKIIKEKLSPYFDLNNAKFRIGYKEKNSFLDNYSIEYYGSFTDGKCSSYYASQKAEEDKEKREAKESYNIISKRYGKKYADAYWANKIIVGMPEELVKGFRPRKLIYESGSSRTYRIGDMTVYVYNGKVTRIIYH